ncbi:hypothetical protein [Aeromonas sp. 102P]|uniref:hypothetical protein n=1 Tax=Aeromonas sp. 102P TaxID=3452711 RepID=UPI003F78B680
MSCSISIDPSAKKLWVNKDSYDLDKISDVQVRTLSLKDKLLNMAIIGAITSSILFIIIPTDENGQVVTTLLPIVTFLIGALIGFAISKKYEFRLEFRYSDEVGVQWFTAAKGRTIIDYQLFKSREVELKHYL